MSEFAWGAPDAEGIALGLVVGASADGACAYRIAVTNRSDQARQVILFATLDDKIRTRIVARQPGAEAVRPAVVPAVPLTSNVRIAIDLAPGQVIERDGAPARFGLAGDAVIHVVLGGVTARPTELRSGEVPVRLSPAA